MSGKDELLKLAELFHSQALRAETPDAKRTLHRMGQSQAVQSLPPSRLHKRGRIASLIDASSLIFLVPTLALSSWYSLSLSSYVGTLLEGCGDFMR